MESETFYVNAPLSEAEHRVLAALAKGNRRAKGQELRLLAVSELYTRGLLKRPPTFGSGISPKPRRAGK
jgi:hypothetical protein